MQTGVHKVKMAKRNSHTLILLSTVILWFSDPHPVIKSQAIFNLREHLSVCPPTWNWGREHICFVCSFWFVRSFTKLPPYLLQQFNFDRTLGNNAAHVFKKCRKQPTGGTAVKGQNKVAFCPWLDISCPIIFFQWTGKRFFSVVWDDEINWQKAYTLYKWHSWFLLKRNVAVKGGNSLVWCL